MSRAKRAAKRAERQQRRQARRNERQTRREAKRDSRQARKVQRMNIRLASRNERVNMRQQANLEKEVVRSEADKIAYENGVDPVERGNSGGGSGDGGGIWQGIKGAVGSIFGKKQEESYLPDLPQEQPQNTFMGLSMPQLLIGLGVIAGLIIMFANGNKKNKRNVYN